MARARATKPASTGDGDGSFAAASSGSNSPASTPRQRSYGNGLATAAGPLGCGAKPGDGGRLKGGGAAGRLSSKSAGGAPGSGGSSLRSTSCALAGYGLARSSGPSISARSRRRGRGVVQPTLDVAQSLGDFFRLGLEVFREHVEASSDNTGDHPQNHQETKQCRHEALVSYRSFSREQGVIMTQKRASAHPQLHHGRFDRALPAWEIHRPRVVRRVPPRVAILQLSTMG